MIIIKNIRVKILVFDAHAHALLYN